jgi:protein-L-isoaspartate O-methyltransferase
MVALAYARLDRFGARVTVREGDWSALHDPRASFDRIVSSYVLDLLPEQAIANVIDASARALAEGGRLCLVGLTFGNTPLSRIVAGGWHALFRLSPRLVGGCRPIRLRPRFEMGGWHLVHHSVVTSFGVPSEVVVADRLSA